MTITIPNIHMKHFVISYNCDFREENISPLRSFAVKGISRETKTSNTVALNRESYVPCVCGLSVVVSVYLVCMGACVWDCVCIHV